MTVKVIDQPAGLEVQLVSGLSVDKVRNLATLPAVAIELIALANNPKSDFQAIVGAVANDPAFCSRLLKVSNSSYYGFSQKVGRVDQAVALLGLNAVKNIAVGASFDKMFRPDKIGPDFDARELWLHCVVVATAAREVAKRAQKCHPDDAFLAGLVHDVGIMLEMQAFRPSFTMLIELLAEEPLVTFREAERRFIGATHEGLGSTLFRYWNFPVHLQHVVGNHHDPMTLAEVDRSLPAVVHVADVLACRSGIGYTRTCEADSISPEILQWLQLDDSDIGAVEEKLPADIEESRQLFFSPSLSELT